MVTKLLGNTVMPTYIKLVSIGVLVLTYCGVLGIAGAYVISHNFNPDSLPVLFVYIIGQGLQMAIGNLGLHVGASAVEAGAGPANPANPAPVPAPTEPAPVASGVAGV